MGASFDEVAKDDLVAPLAQAYGFYRLIPIYVINLKRSRDRREWMQSELCRAGVEAEFLTAVDGRRFKARCEMKKGFLSKQEAALTLSHRMAWRKLLASEANCAVILEDDVHIGAGFREFLRFDFARHAFDAIKLETCASTVWLSREGWSVGGRKLHRLGYEHLGSAAYIVSRVGAGKLLRATKRLVEPVDVALFGKRAIFKREIHVLQIVPAISIQDRSHPDPAARRELASTLNEDGALRKVEARRNKPRGRKRVEREVARIADQVWRWMTLTPTMRRMFIPWE